MPEIDEKIAAWRTGIAEDGAIDDKTVRELESHLREAIDAGESFESAVAQLGTNAGLEAEFEKVYPAVSWSRRALWLAAGYGFASLSAWLIVWANRLVEAFSMLLFPSATIKLPVPLNFERDESHIVYWMLPEGTHSVTHVPLALLLGGLATLLTCLALIGFSARALQGKSPWTRRVARDAKSLTVFVLATCGLSIVLSSFWAWRLFSRSIGVRGQGALIAGGGADEVTYSAVHFWFSNAITVCWCLSFVFSICALLWLRRRKISGYRAWAFAGPFVISSVASLIGLFGTAVGMLAVTLIPGVRGQEAPMQSWILFHVNSMGSMITMVCQLLLFLTLMIVSHVMLGRRRWILAERFSGFVARFGLPLLLLWVGARSAWMWGLGLLPPSALIDRIGAVSAIPALPKGAWMALLLIAVAILPRRKGPGRRRSMFEIAEFDQTRHPTHRTMRALTALLIGTMALMSLSGCDPVPPYSKATKQSLVSGAAVEMSFSIPAGGSPKALVQEAMKRMGATGTADFTIWNDPKAGEIKIVIEKEHRALAETVMAGLGCTKS